MLPFADADAIRRGRPLVNNLLLSLNGLVFLYQLTLGGLAFLFGGDSLELTRFFLTWGFIPRELTEGQAYQSLLAPGDIATPLPTWATIFTAMFIHGGLLHLAGNLMFLWVFGRSIEERLGHIKYLLFYLATGVAAALTHWFIDQNSAIPMVGASGAIAGVMGAYLLLYPRHRINTLIIFFFITVVQVSATLLLGLWFLWQLIQGILSIGVSGQVSVAFWAHIGGFVAGAAIIALWKLLTGQPLRPPRPLSRPPTKYWRGRPLD